MLSVLPEILVIYEFVIWVVVLKKLNFRCTETPACFSVLLLTKCYGHFLPLMKLESREDIESLHDHI
jgi:hypothetical protein